MSFLKVFNVLKSAALFTAASLGLPLQLPLLLQLGPLLLLAAPGDGGGPTGLHYTLLLWHWCCWRSPLVSSALLCSALVLLEVPTGLHCTPLLCSGA